MAFDRILYAGRAWPILTRVANATSVITYGELAKELSIHHRQCRLFLEILQEHCMKTGLAPITALVIRKATGLPGHGFIAWDIADPAAAKKAVYAEKWDTIPNPFDFAVKGQTTESLGNLLLKPNPEWRTVYSLVESRGYRQVVFREALLRAYDRRCAISGCGAVDLLERRTYFLGKKQPPKNGWISATAYYSPQLIIIYSTSTGSALMKITK